MYMVSGLLAVIWLELVKQYNICVKNKPFYTVTVKCYYCTYSVNTATQPILHLPLGYLNSLIKHLRFKVSQ